MSPKQHASFVLAALGCCLLPSHLSAADLPAGKGRETFQKVCTECHDLEATVKLRQSRAAWTNLVRSMKDMGASASEAELSQVVDYLSASFGPNAAGGASGKKTEAPVVEAVSRPTRRMPWEKNHRKIGQALYRENCIVCHDNEAETSKKIGPNFSYMSNPRDSRPKLARSHIAAKIRVGGPKMPAFAKTLNNQEIESLIDYLQSKP